MKSKNGNCIGKFFILLILMTSVLFLGCIQKEEQEQQDVLSRVDEIQMNQDQKSIGELKKIIETDPDNHTRERAIFVLSNIEIKKNVTAETIDFLKGIAYNEENDAVRTAAYANLARIREKYPFEPDDALEVRVKGDVRKGSTITVYFNVKTTQKLDANAWIKLTDFRNDTARGIILKDKIPVRFSIDKGETREIPFNIYIQREGEYLILAALKLNLDKVDSRTIKKAIFLKVESNSGSFNITNTD